MQFLKQAHQACFLGSFEQNLMPEAYCYAFQYQTRPHASSVSHIKGLYPDNVSKHSLFNSPRSDGLISLKSTEHFHPKIKSSHSKFDFGMLVFHIDMFLVSSIHYTYLSDLSLEQKIVDLGHHCSSSFSIN